LSDIQFILCFLPTLTFFVADDHHVTLVYITLLDKTTFSDYRLLLGYSKWTNTFVRVDHTSVNGPKIVPACSVTENLIEYRYDLCLMGIPIHSPLVFLGATTSLVTFCPDLSRTLNQRHRIHECVTAMINHIIHHDDKLGTFNIADLTLNFQPSKADPAFWYHEFEGQYEYIARYVDDLMNFAHCTDTIIKILHEPFFIHTCSTNTVFLGGDVFSLQAGCPFISVKTYINQTCKKIETPCDVELQHFDDPMATDDHHENEDTQFFDPKFHSIYRFLTDAGKWVITVGRFDILLAVSTLSRVFEPPRTGHLARPLRVFGYLKFNSTLGISMVPTTSSFPISPTVVANGVPIYWHSKQQNTTETSTFESEIVAARIAAEKVLEYQYKLRMMGVPIHGPSILFSDNKSVISTCSKLPNTLKKRHNALAYHKLRECVAAGIIHIFHVDGKLNIADILNKPVPGDIFRRHRARLLVKPPI